MSLALPSSNWRHVGRGRCHELRSRHINPNNYTLPIAEPNSFGREIEFANRAREYESEQDLSQLTDYWGSVDTSRESTSTEESRASTPTSEYVRSRNWAFASPAPEITCLCGIDLCTCGVRPD